MSKDANNQITNTVEICSGCGREHDFGNTGPDYLVYRQQELEKEGWTNHYGYWYCQDCSRLSTVR